MHYIIIIFCFFSTLGFANGTTFCRSGYTMVNNKCWKLFQGANTRTADDRCRSDHGGILVTLKNAIDNRGLFSFLNNNNVDRLWLGMTCTGLSKNSCHWADQTIVDYNSFASGFPNSAFGNCVYYSVNGYPAGQWASGECNEELPFVCELPTSTPNNVAPCNYIYNNHCYTQSIGSPKSFSDAQTFCESISSNLMSIHSYLENRFVSSILPKYEYIWLGGLAPSKERILWTDGSLNDYNRLANVQNGSCVEMSMYAKDDNSTLSWFGSDCSQEKEFVCKRPTIQN